MYQIAVVDDVQADAEKLNQAIRRFEKEKDTVLNCTHYDSAETFLEDYRGQFDIVFMDIRMGGMDGMKAARRLREKDQSVILIFLTSLAQYAVQGYEVDALDYILKPLTWPALELKLTKALSRCRKDVQEIVIATGNDKVRIQENELVWVEVYEHHLQYKTVHDVLRGYGTLKDVEAKLPEKRFFRVNNQTIVNLRYVSRISGNLATVAGRSFEISRMRKKDFLAQFHRYGVFSV